MSKHLPWVFICSTAPALKLSQAARSTLNPYCLQRQATLARLVLLPTPFTPMNVTTQGLWVALFSIASFTKSMCLEGVRIFVSDSFIVSFTVYFTDTKLLVLLSSSTACTESASLLAISSATFLLINCSFKVFRMAYTSCYYISLLPVMSPMVLYNLPHNPFAYQFPFYYLIVLLIISCSLSSSDS